MSSMSGNPCEYLCDLLTQVILVTGLPAGTDRSWENSVPFWHISLTVQTNR